MAEAPLSLQTWWDTATAVTYLRDGALPEHRSNIDWRSLPKAALQVRILNAALQSDKLETIELIVGGEQRKLPMEEKATLAVRFSEYAALGGRIGVRFEVVNTNTGTGNQAVATNDADVDVDAAIAAMRDVPRTHVIRILRDLHRQNRLRKDMLPHVVRKLVEDPFKDRFGKKAPSRRTKDRAWEYYLEKFLK
jgi:hypothetical protein